MENKHPNNLSWILKIKYFKSITMPTLSEAMFKMELNCMPTCTKAKKYGKNKYYLT
jgi:hypothetical protein